MHSLRYTNATQLLKKQSVWNCFVSKNVIWDLGHSILIKCNYVHMQCNLLFHYHLTSKLPDWIDIVEQYLRRMQKSWNSGKSYGNLLSKALWYENMFVLLLKGMVQYMIRVTNLSRLIITSQTLCYNVSCLWDGLVLMTYIVGYVTNVCGILDMYSHRRILKYSYL